VGRRLGLNGPVLKRRTGWVWWPVVGRARAGGWEGRAEHARPQTPAGLKASSRAGWYPPGLDDAGLGWVIPARAEGCGPGLEGV